MHGVVFAELRKYVDTKFGGNTWDVLLEKSGNQGKVYFPIQAYSDEEAVSLVSAASGLTQQPVVAILADFGEFIAPDLLAMYKHLLKPHWKTLDVIENTEQTIHSVVRVKNPGAQPPQLKVTRRSPEEVVITYASARKMCSLGKGIAQGMAKHFKENIRMTDLKCMAKNDPICEISVRLLH